MKILITGARGVLGSALARAAGEAGTEVLPVGREAMDITDLEAVRRIFADTRPDTVVNCAAFPDVDAAQENLQEALRVNRDGARNVAMAAGEVMAGMVHISTDYVFDGRKTDPYLPSDQPAPLNLYGISKLAGEVAVRDAHPSVLVLRTSWIFGEGGRGFVAWIHGALKEDGPPIRVVADERSRPTFAPELAQGILDLVQAGATGNLHLANSGDCTRMGLAQEVRDILGSDRELIPVSSESFGAPARRPAYSVLDLSGAEAILARSLPTWQQSLKRYLKP